MDSEYLREHLGSCLTDCLADVCEKRPKDPIEYMAHWMYKYLDNVNYAKEETAKALALQKEMEDFAKDQEMKSQMKEEQMKIVEETKHQQVDSGEEKKDAEKTERAPTPPLSTVAEKEDAEPTAEEPAASTEEESTD